MPFEVYRRGTAARKVRGETVTIGRRGLISFSDDAWERLGSPEAVIFLADTEERLIGFRPARRGEEGSYSVRAAQRTVSGTALCRHMGIDTSQGRRYPLACDGEVPYIDLKQPGTPVTSNRRAA